MRTFDVIFSSLIVVACAIWAPNVGAASLSAADQKIVRADVVAIDQELIYNRFGSRNSCGMIYALRSDLDTSSETPKLRSDKRPRPLVLRVNLGDILEVTFSNALSASAHAPDCPQTRNASLVVQGMPLMTTGAEAAVCSGLESLEPGAAPVTCRWFADPETMVEGTRLFSSYGAPAGGQGNGGSLPHGLFGAVNIEPAGSQWFRSQVTADVFDAAWNRAETGPRHARLGLIDYSRLSMLRQTTEPMEDDRAVFDLIHSDLNAIILETQPPPSGTTDPYEESMEDRDEELHAAAPAFREFTIIFHDELRTKYAEPFEVLEQEQFAGIRDGFAINYGASGMGTILLANRLGIGPSAACVECEYEEFFLQSWPNGDPALLESYEDDPSNVHNSYLNDRVKFRNLHAGPKETHVFHLHAHQWLSQADEEGTYLDSQTIAPLQGFSYEIYRGGRDLFGQPTSGTGNRNRTPGDSIFHCHLYPHFAQGMWALWRAHDVLEDGTRKLPDGQAAPGLSEVPRTPDSYQVRRRGTDPQTGETNDGTPIPALVPLPKQAVAPLPTYGEDGMPGFPFYIDGEPGRRVQQPPHDMALDENAEPQNAGLPRHVMHGEGRRGMAGLTADEIEQGGFSGADLIGRSLVLGDMTAHLEEANLRTLPHEGTPLEQQGIAFHAGKTAAVAKPDGSAGLPVAEGDGYESITPEGVDAVFRVNGGDPQPGAPFADPCHDPAWRYESKKRRYDVSAIDLRLVTNAGGWHDPQARINILDSELGDALPDPDSGLHFGGEPRNDMQPFFFRAASGECVEYRHTNRTRDHLELDDFQVKTPTDTIGQHIHLVKFDVTSSDGSANGYNYEDGTFASGAVQTRIAAAQAGSATDHSGNPVALAFNQDKPFQTTIQRWYADPIYSINQADGIEGTCPPGSGLTDAACLDKTLRTVFTHDHFGPSSIQQHGFYSALLIEPAGSMWWKPDGTQGGLKRMCDPAALELGNPAADSSCVPAVGTHAMIANVASAPGNALHWNEYREFALAIADFALLYDPRGDECGGMDQLLKELDRDPGCELPEEAHVEAEPDPDAPVEPEPPALSQAAVTDADRDRLATYVAANRQANGRPVAPPIKPESISVDHHDPYLVNYKGAPTPLRIGKTEYVLRDTDCGLSVDVQQPGESIRLQKDDPDGDLSNLFSSLTHGDPCTPIIEAYEGEPLQIRLIQGAQEVQHMMTVENGRWRRVADYGKRGVLRRAIQDGDAAALRALARTDNLLGFVSAQEVGISEHHEMEIGGRIGFIATGLDRQFMAGAQPTFVPPTDSLYHFGTQDALWNGAWGLLRIYPNMVLTPDRTDLANLRANGVPVPDAPPAGQERLIWNRLARVEDARGAAEAMDPSVVRPPLRPLLAATVMPYRSAMAQNVERALTRLDSDETVEDKIAAFGTSLARDVGLQRDVEGVCTGRETKIFHAVALPFGTESEYNSRGGITDPNGLVLRPVSLDGDGMPDFAAAEAALSADDDVTPYVLRINAGDCVDLTIHNRIPAQSVQALDADGSASALDDQIGDACMPKIAGLNVDARQGESYDPNCATDPERDIRSSPKIAFTLPLVSSDAVSMAGGASSIGKNADDMSLQETDKPAGFGGSVRLQFYAGFVTVPSGQAVTDCMQSAENCDPLYIPYAFGPIPLKPMGDPFGHAAHGLFGAVIVEPETSEYSSDGDAVHGTTATIRYTDDEGEPQEVTEHILFFQDGLNLHKNGVPVPDCPICDDSYDRGDMGASYRSEPFWSRLDMSPSSDLNTASFGTRFFADREPATPVLKAQPDDEVWLRVVQPYGRARQRSANVVGHSFDDLLPEFGSPTSPLMSAGKAITAKFKAREGCWMWRDGPAQIFAGGVWGWMEVGDGQCARTAETPK